MSISLFDLFKIGIGPSSSHTVGPMRGAAIFARDLMADPELAPRIAQVAVHLYGSLAATGAGHGTLDAVIMGLEGNDPALVDPVAGRERVAAIEERGGLLLDGTLPIDLRPSGIVLHPLTFLPQHSNGMTFVALDAEGEEVQRRPMFSVGGGFVIDEADMDQSAAEAMIPLPSGRDAERERRLAVFSTAAELLRVCEESGLSISRRCCAANGSGAPRSRCAARRWPSGRPCAAASTAACAAPACCPAASRSSAAPPPGTTRSPQRTPSTCR